MGKKEKLRYFSGRNSILKIKLFLVLMSLFIIPLIFTSCRDIGVNGVVYVYCYGDYYDPEIVREFEDKTGITVIQDSYDTAEEMYHVISKNSTDYDAVCTSDYMIDKLRKEGYLAPLDKKNIKNIDNIDPVYMKKSCEFDPGNIYSVPHVAGVAGIAYDKREVGNKDINSWDALWDKEYKNEIVMPDSLRDAFMISLKRLGYSENTTNESEIKQASDELIKQKPLVYKYANDNARDLIADGSAKLGFIWNGEYYYTKELNKNIKFVVPEEGSESFIDSWVIPKSAKNKANAEKWINYLSEAKVAKRNFDYLHYTVPNLAAMKLIDDKYINDENIFPTEDILSRCEGLKYLGNEADSMYGNYWKKVKSSR